MGVHTGDSITVAPAQTLTDREYQRMRDASLAIIREIGVETGGSNIQFAVNPDDGRMIVIEMNPRVSRSSALASKATGFPIAKIAAKLAVGYTLDEIHNDITRETPACFEPTIDYVRHQDPALRLREVPGRRPDADDADEVGRRGDGDRPHLQGVAAEGAALARDRPLGLGLDARRRCGSRDGERRLRADAARRPTPERCWSLAAGAARAAASLEEIHEATEIDPWFLEQMRELVDFEQELARRPASTRELLREAKELGFSDAQIARLAAASATTCARRARARRRAGLQARRHLRRRVRGAHALLYSTYEDESEARAATTEEGHDPRRRPEPHRPGHRVRLLLRARRLRAREIGFETIMVNCNPETVSTDYDTSDRLYFEPLTLEDVLHIVEREKPDGVIVQFGGQTPLKLAAALEAGRADPRHLAGRDRPRRGPRALRRAARRSSASPAAERHRQRTEEAVEVAERIGYPVLVRPSYVLGGRAMEIVYDERARALHDARRRGVARAPGPRRRVPRGRHRGRRRRVSDGETWSSAASWSTSRRPGSTPATRLRAAAALAAADVLDEIARDTRARAGARRRRPDERPVRRQGATVYVIEVNPRASRTVPFVSKAIGVPLAKLAAKVMAGETLASSASPRDRPAHFAVKEPVFPFTKFPGVDTILGPEMRSTGEVMGIADNFPDAFYKALLSAYLELPDEGKVFISVKENDKPAAADLARRLKDLGFDIIATKGTREVLERAGSRRRTSTRWARAGRTSSTFCRTATSPSCSTRPRARRPFATAARCAAKRC